MNETPGNELAEKSEKQLTPKIARLVSLDAFRGLTIMGMLLVNNVALERFTPTHLQHAPWNGGVVFADMVFPWFLFIVGVAIPYAAASSRAKSIPHWKYLLKAFNRALMLILLGCLIDSSLAKTPVVDLGVLQIIGLAYLVAALVYPLKTQWRMAVAAIFLLAYWALVRFVHIPGEINYVFSEDKNIIKYINESHLSYYHLQGLLSVVPTAAMVMIGSAIGDFLRREALIPRRKAAYIAAIGVGLALLGMLWSIDLPFNKPVWTPSYILYTAGWACIVFSSFYYVVDVAGLRTFAFPFIIFGMNAIAAYVMPILAKAFILQEWHWNGSHLALKDDFLRMLVNHYGQITGGWMYTATYMFVWWLVMYILYRKKLFLRV